MKQVIIGDIHGRDIWKQILIAEEPFDRVIFLGDYFDSREGIAPLKQLENFLDIVKFKEDNLNRVIMLIGNHDWHYLPYINSTGMSGFQYQMYPTFSHVLGDNEVFLQMAFADENGVLYTHAGVSQIFLANNDIPKGTPSEVAENINLLFKHKPYAFEYYSGDRSGYGENPNQSCIWIREQALYRSQIGCLQVVGHTTVNQIDKISKGIRRGFMMIDCLHNRQYLVCNKNQFEVKQLPKE
jgi:hypothetical protein